MPQALAARVEIGVIFDGSNPFVRIPAKLIGRWWLGGAKYTVSKALAGKKWEYHPQAVFQEFGINTHLATTLAGVVGLLSGKVFWDWDPFHGIIDYVKPLYDILKDGTGDCDDHAYLHANLIESVLGFKGWRVQIVSYVAVPFWMSHHFALAIDPKGRCWPVQPQPSRLQEQPVPSIWDSWVPSAEDAAKVVAASYGAGVEWWDTRDAAWRLVEPARYLQ